MKEFEQLYNLKLTPSYSVLYRKPRKRRSSLYRSEARLQMAKSTAQQENEKNLKTNKHKGYLSEKAVKRLKMAINWLVSASTPKKIYDPKRNRSFKFSLAFVTLTLPSGQNDHSDNFIKKELLNPFLMVLKNRYDLTNYVWKAEAQDNGNIHFHIIVDIYIPHQELRFLWNRLLIKKGFMKEYTSKFINMNLNEYRKFTNNLKQTDFEIIKKRFIYGKSTKWSNPNTTDIHSVKDIKNLAAYLATYMAKKDFDKRGITGRIWSCSYSLSDKNKCVIELSAGDIESSYDLLYKVSQDVIFIDNKPEDPKDLVWVATVFLIKHQDLLKIPINWIKKKYISHLNGIRQGSQRRQLNLVS